MLAAFGLGGSQQDGVMAVPARSLKLQEIAVGVDMFRDLCQSEAMKNRRRTSRFMIGGIRSGSGRRRLDNPEEGGE